MKKRQSADDRLKSNYTHMKQTSFLLLCCFVLSVAMANDKTPNLKIIPAPANIEIKDGTLTIDEKTTIGFSTAADKKIAELLGSFIDTKFGLKLPITKDASGANVVLFSSSNTDGITHPEGYTLEVRTDGAVLSGKDAGLFYALQSLLQLFPVDKDSDINLQAVSIQDEPRYNYRGLHLDVCRHMFPVSFIKEYIDYMAAYKLNNFHWHLTEDQGWRIEIKKYPKLTEIGGYRAQTLIGQYKDNGNYDGIPYGGFYTQEEVKEIIAYAAERHINVIPEIELPGHALAALSAYPHLGCGHNPGPYKAAETWGVFEDVFCAGKEETFAFLEDVLSEVIDLFPSKYIHIGGDECPKTKWKECPFCQKRIKDEGLADEHELQSYFIQRIEKFVNSKGRQIIGWDEILEGGLAPNATVMSWRGEDGGVAAAKQGHDVIMTANSYGLYFDHKQGPDHFREPLNIGGYAPLEKVYSSDPTPKSLSGEEKKHVIGVQANVWTEYMETGKKVEFMILPRIFALSEIAWTDPANKNWKDFSETRVPSHLAKLDQTDAVYRVPEVLGLKDTVIYASEYTFRNLKPSVEGGTIYYTIDNHDPRETDLVYDGEVKVVVQEGRERIFKATVFSPSGRPSNYVRAIVINTKEQPYKVD